MLNQSNHLFTCVTCNVAFDNPETQREHYKTDWHRYNLKRKVAELAPISFENFQEKLNQQKVQENGQNQKIEEMFCKLCQKHFSSNSYANHVQAKKHKDLETKAKVNGETEANFIIKSDRATKKAEQLEQDIKKKQQLLEEMEKEVEIDEDEEMDDKDWEDVGEDEDLGMFNEANGIALNTCLFCDHKSESAESKCEHMAKEHSFFIPDNEFVSDLEGLLKFLGVKVGAYHVCLWCSTKCYRDLKSVQKHMHDKGHQRMKFEGETLLEYADFYTYPGDYTIDDEYDILNKSDMSNISTISLYSENDVNLTGDLNDESFELVLPSGARIGHRSLFRYYKQSFGHRNLELKLKSNISLRDKYKAIALNSNYTQAEIQKQRKDMAYFQRWSAKMHAKLGWKANKLQKHIRRQDIMF